MDLQIVVIMVINPETSLLFLNVAWFYVTSEIKTYIVMAVGIQSYLRVTF